MSTRIFVENNSVLANGTLILSDNQTGRIEIGLPLDASIVTEIIKLDLTWSNRDQKETDVKWHASEGRVRFDFLGWKGQGTTLREPILFGYDQRENPLFLHIYHVAVGNKNVVQFLIMQQSQS